ncbi:MAG: terminase [Magnetococcales bacterium]|nr:terminase [Magnetococcales bacterium]
MNRQNLQYQHAGATGKGKSRHLTPARKRAFLLALAETGCLGHACRAVGVSRQAVHEWRRDDQVFAGAVEEALEQAADQLEIAARRRAVEGVQEPVYQGGQQVGIVQRYSDTLLLALLRAHRPAFRTAYQQAAPPEPPSTPVDPATAVRAFALALGMAAKAQQSQRVDEESKL